MELKERITKIFENKKGIAFVGDNSKGKTYIMEEMVECYKNDVKIIYIPESCQNLDVINHNENINGIQFGKIKKVTALRELKNIYEDRLPERDEKNKAIKKPQKQDEEATIIAKRLTETTPKELIDFFKNKLEFQLDFNKTPLEIKIKDYEYSKLTSSGYKAMIRIVSEIFFYLTEIPEENILIVIDEIDAKFYWTNREKYFKVLEKFIRDTFSNKNIKFMISTHMSETITNLSEGYSIIKILNTKNNNIEYLEYESNDFLNQDQVNRIIFDKNTEVFKESKALLNLKKLYFIILKNNIRISSIEFNNFSINIKYDRIDIISSYNFNYNLKVELDAQTILLSELSLKEKVLFNSIVQLTREDFNES